ncbi:hypothetical protein D3C84_68340 [compost metagenome]
MGEIVAIGHRPAVALGCRAQGAVPGQGPGGGKTLPAAQARFGPRGIDLGQQRLACRTRVCSGAVEQGLGQHHAPLIAIAVDADVGVLAVEQRPAVAPLKHGKGVVGIVGADQQHRAHRYCLIARFPECLAQPTVVIDGQGQFRFERQRPQALDRAMLTAAGVGAVAIDGRYQLALATGVGGAGEHGKQGNKAQRGNAGGANGRAHRRTALEGDRD